jgi:hypothetical protein
MNRRLGDRVGQIEVWDEQRSEESVTDWLAQHELKNWVPSALVLAVLLLTIVLLPLSRLF